MNIDIVDPKKGIFILSYKVADLSFIFLFAIPEKTFTLAENKSI
ncbi:hypothetical protein BH11BAC1_BH11BAC1_27640 [soil metagenome]